MTAFEEMGVLPEIAAALEEQEWTLPTDVQSEAIPLILGGGDVLMAAETGSGKTGAFCLPILQIVWENLTEQKGGKSKPTAEKSDTWKMSHYDRDSALAVSTNGLTCQCKEQGWHGCRATKGVAKKGKYFYEVKISEGDGLCRIGWSTPEALLNLGTDKLGFGFGGTGRKSFKNKFDAYGEPFSMHDVIGCMIDLDIWRIGFWKNGKYLDDAFEIPHNMRGMSFFPAAVLKNAELVFRFEENELDFMPSGGYKAVSSAPKENVVESIVSGPSSVPVKKLKNAPQALIIEPSRELAEQTLKCIQNFKVNLHNPSLKDALIIGGMSAKDQILSLQNGVDIVVGTPGRLEDLISTDQLSLSQVRFFVLDECDGLLSSGYTDLINRMHAKIPKFSPEGRRLQMIVCSATLHSFDVKKLAERLMRFPTWVDLKGEDSVPETVHHVVCMVDPIKDSTWRSLSKRINTDEVHKKDNIHGGNQSAESLSEAVKILKGEYTVRAITENKVDQAIVFCRTKVDCDNLETYFNHKGGGAQNRNNQFSCVCLHGDRKPPERKANLEKFKGREVKFLICTDVAARGLDITGVPYVINVTLPDEKSNYVHRIGRVGRAERMGLAISLVASVPEKVWYHSNCAGKGRNCYNTRLREQGGCCMWYNELQYLADIEEHLNCTIQQVERDLNIPADNFDGNVSYGQKKALSGSNYKTHTDQMAPAVKSLAKLEERSQTFFIKRYNKKSYLK